VPPGSVVVAAGVRGTPCTFVHWSRSSVAFAGTTVESAAPCQIVTRGHGPAYPGFAARTRSPHCAGVRFCAWYWQIVPQSYGSPAITAPPANTSGYAASIAAVIAPPADRPVTYTRRGSAPKRVTAASTICRIDSASPWPRRMSPVVNQLKQDSALFAEVCSGSTSAAPYASAYLSQPACPK
jgi:hypothetical protein